MTKPSLHIALISEHASRLAVPGSVDADGRALDIAEVVQNLAAAGHTVDVLTRREDAKLPAVACLCPSVRVLQMDAGPACFVPNGALLPHMPAFAEAVRRLRGRPYDVLHAQFSISGWVGLALRLSLGVPLVTSFHAPAVGRRAHLGAADQVPPARIGIERALALQSDRVIAACPEDAIDLMRLFGTPRERISSVPCGVDSHAFRPGDKGSARQRLGLPADRFLVLHLGSLAPRNGIDNVIRALALMPPGQDPLLLVVGGESVEPDERFTPEIGQLRRVASAHGVGRQVQFVGRRDRPALRDWYLAADVVVSTPWSQSCGTTALQAMACARPVVGSDVGGMAHAVVDGVTGFLVPPKDPDALAVRLNLLQADPARGAKMGLAGTDLVRRQHTWAQVARQLAAVYTDVVLAQDGAMPQRPSQPPAMPPGQHLSLVPSGSGLVLTQAAAVPQAAAVAQAPPS